MVKRKPLQKMPAMAGMIILLLAASCAAQTSSEIKGAENRIADASSSPGLENAVQEMNSSVSRAIAAPELVSPSAVLNTGKPTYIWKGVNGCMYYCLEVRDNLGNVVLKQWYNASDLPPAPGRCSVTPPIVLDPGDYEWRVMCWNCTESQWSSVMEFTICTSSSYPGKAILVSPKDLIGTRNPTFVWKAVTGCTQYCLKVADASHPNVPIFEECYDVEEVLSGQICSITPGLNLDAGSYRWWIKTINCKGDGPWSNFMSFRYLDRPPGRSTPISPNGLVSTSRPKFIWTAASAATEYHLQVNNSSNNIVDEWFDADEVTQGSRCSALLPVALPDDDVVYFWRIRASNDAGNGSWSSYRYFETVSYYSSAARKKARMD
jgi:hypothetical protein